MACARGEMFGPGNPQLPAPPMLMMDRVTDISADRGAEGKGHVVAEFDIRPDLWFFQCHFLGDPVMPGCLGLDALWQLTGFNLGWRGMQGRGRALGVGEVKFTGMVTPKVKLIEYTVDFTRVIDRKLKLGIANGTDAGRRRGDLHHHRHEGRPVPGLKEDAAMRRVVITGLGIVSSIGNNAEEVARSLKAGRSGISFAPDYAEHGFRCQVHGQARRST